VIGDADADTLPGFDCIPQAVCQLQPWHFKSLGL
jgi:hypothetical protein